jgi:uncharacterized membrane protein YdjX (TVP38/TMEM64 family)
MDERPEPVAKTPPAAWASSLSGLLGGLGLLIAWRLAWFFLAWHLSGLHPSLDSFVAHREELEAWTREQPLDSWLAFLALYTLICALYLDGTATLVVVAGALYGPLPGLAACTLGSSLGALAAFLFSRRFLRTWVQTHFKKTLAATEAGLKKDGDAWLLSARLIPMVSFAGVNLAMGLSSMKPGRFLLISTLGLLPCNAAYVWAGMHLARIPIHNPADLLSPQLWALLCGVGLLPLLATLVRRLHRSLKEPG